MNRYLARFIPRDGVGGGNSSPTENLTRCDEFYEHVTTFQDFCPAARAQFNIRSLYSFCAC